MRCNIDQCCMSCCCAQSHQCVIYTRLLRTPDTCEVHERVDIEHMLIYQEVLELSMQAAQDKTEMCTTSTAPHSRNIYPLWAVHLKWLHKQLKQAKRGQVKAASTKAANSNRALGGSSSCSRLRDDTPESLGCAYEVGAESAAAGQQTSSSGSRHKGHKQL